MKVTVVYNRQRQTFNEVEVLSYGDFFQAVAATFGLDENEFDILLGENVVLLEDSRPLSDFGVISGDLLHVRLTNDPSRQGHPMDTSEPSASTASGCRDEFKEVVPDPITFQSSSSTSRTGFTTTNTASAHDKTTKASLTDTSTCVSSPELHENENLDEFLVSLVKRFMNNAQFQELEQVYMPRTTPITLCLNFDHVQSPNTFVEIRVDLFRDNVNRLGSTVEQNPTQARDKSMHSDGQTAGYSNDGINNEDRVTSASLTSMIVLRQQRYFIDTIYTDRSVGNLSEHVVENFLTPLKQRVLGPDNSLLQMLSRDYAANVFRYLSPKDVLHVEQTCKYANSKCRSLKIIDETVWKHHFTKKFGDIAPNDAQPSTSSSLPQTNESTYRELYKRKTEEGRQRGSQVQRNIFHPPAVPVPDWPHVEPTPRLFGIYPNAPNTPMNNPDMNPFAPNPFGGGLIAPSRPPQRPQLGPRIDPHYPDVWPDPFAPDGGNPPDPDMPHGPTRHDGFEPRGPRHPTLPRRNGGQNPPFGGGFIG